jgi:acetolactate synthase regulatory subunit
MKEALHSNQLTQAFRYFSEQQEREIERICNANHQEFVGSVNSLLQVREGTVQMTTQILELNESIQESIEKLAAQKKALVDSRSVRQNIAETNQAINACLNVLRLANQVVDFVREKNHYGALRALDELQNIHLKEVSRYKIAEMIEKSVPTTQKMIADAVMADLNTWLYRIRESSQLLGEVAFYYTDVRRSRNQARIEADERFAKFKLNSAIELVADETDEFDILNNEETDLEVVFTPLFEAMHIHETLGKGDQFRSDYAKTRREQKDLLMPQTLNLLDEECGDLSTLLEGIAGFAIIEKATMTKTDNLRHQVDVSVIEAQIYVTLTLKQVEELWDSMCLGAIALISKALPAVQNDELLLKVKGRVSLFMLTMEVSLLPPSPSQYAEHVRRNGATQSLT